MKTVRVSRKGADRVFSGHPWIFASDVLDRGDAERGDAVRVVDPRNKPLGTAHYSSTSQITLRMLSPRVELIGAEWYRARIKAAIEYRERFVKNTVAYRVVSSEGDFLPGLTVDRYAETLVVQTLTQGMDRDKPVIVDCLTELLQPAAIVERNDVPVRSKEDLPQTSGVIQGQTPELLTVEMNGLSWAVDVFHGQKTGIFLDQRENYLAAANYGRGRALDCFTFSGGFSLHLARTCESVLAIDSSAVSLEIAQRNAERNGIRNVEFLQDDAFDTLTRFSHQNQQQFDTIILDPPAFTKSRTSVDGAARGYKDINQRALRIIRPGGILVSCSCSHHFTEALLLETIASAALDANRRLRVIERRTQAQDHPILLTVPETHYLKCLILQVL